MNHVQYRLAVREVVYAAHPDPVAVEEVTEKVGGTDKSVLDSIDALDIVSTNISGQIFLSKETK